MAMRERTAAGSADYSPIAGVLAVVLWIISVPILDPVTNKETGVEILAQYKEHDGRIFLGSVLWLIGTALFFWWLGTLRAHLRAAESPGDRLTALAYGGGVATAVCLMLVVGPDMAGAINNDDLDASAASALTSVGDVFFIGAEYLLPVMLVATALLALRTLVLPRWLAWVTLFVALVLLIAPIGWAALIFAFPLWILVVSFLLWRKSSRPIATTAP
jgi:hypothetical protein